MSSVNKVILVGRLGKDPEIRQTQGGELANLTVATSEHWKDKSSGERKEKTEWHKVVIFNEHIVKVVEQYARKGNNVYVEGQLQTRKWTGDDGKENYSTEIVLTKFKGEFQLLEGKPPAEVKPVVQKPDLQDRPTVDLDDDVPF